MIGGKAEHHTQDITMPYSQRPPEAKPPVSLNCSAIVGNSRDLVNGNNVIHHDDAIRAQPEGIDQIPIRLPERM